MLKSLLVVLALALSMLAGASFANAQVDDMCTRFLDDNSYSCWVVCDDETYTDDCLSFNTTSPGHFEIHSARVNETFRCSCDNRIKNSGTEFNESHSFLCFMEPDESDLGAFDGTVNRSINFDGNMFEDVDGGRNCTYKCKLTSSCGG